ncbi:MAG: element excision factor XisH family protein [Saprospiraceae bacterium]
MAKDKFHDNVRLALQKDGWVITAEQFRIDLGVSFIEVDLMAEIPLVAERAGERIAVEVKSFLGKSFMSDFHTAIGQFLDYRTALEETDPDRILYLAIPVHAWEHKVFQGRFIQKRIQMEQVKTIIFDESTNTILSWIK